MNTIRLFGSNKAANELEAVIFHSSKDSGLIKGVLLLIRVTGKELKMKQNRFKVGIVFLLMFALVFSSMGTSAFAAKPPKPPKPAKSATIEVVESLPLIVPLGNSSISTNLIVMNDDGEEPEASASLGDASIAWVSAKRKSTTYEMTYTKPDTYNGDGSETVTVTVYNVDGNPTSVDIPIDIEQSAPPINEAPENITPPDIDSTFFVGDPASPILGTWDDDHSIPVVTRTWELSEGTSIPVAGDLVLLAAWDGLSIAIKEVAVDEEGLETSFISAYHPITDPGIVTDLIYVALGDSIATGTVAPTFDNETTYVEYFGIFLHGDTGRNVITRDFSSDGDQTSHLLDRLNGGDPDMIAQVRVADIITLSIGGNNLMNAAKYHTLFLGFIPVDYYDFERIDLAKAEAGRQAFIIQFPAIIQKIRAYNPDAQIIVNTIYNPFKGIQDVANHTLLEGYLYRIDKLGINDVILATDGIDVAPVHQAFETRHFDTKDAITYMYITDTYFGFELRNPHPNHAGQVIIEEMHEDVYRPL
jgi:lysophospholipase L1-like esterase